MIFSENTGNLVNLATILHIHVYRTYNHRKKTVCKTVLFAQNEYKVSASSLKILRHILTFQERMF